MKVLVLGTMPFAMVSGAPIPAGLPAQLPFAKTSYLIVPVTLVDGGVGVIVAVSLNPVPTVMELTGVPEVVSRVVVKVGVGNVTTVRVSLVAPHVVETGLLLASPL